MLVLNTLHVPLHLVVPYWISIVSFIFLGIDQGWRVASAVGRLGECINHESLEHSTFKNVKKQKILSENEADIFLKSAPNIVPRALYVDSIKVIHLWFNLEDMDVT
jgi:hypothetical protein